MSETFLDKIVAIQREKVGRQKTSFSLATVKDDAFTIRRNAEEHRLQKALKRKDRTNIIAEIKRASPSKGVINDGINVSGMAINYRDGGAAAISVLTEGDFFKGTLDDVKEVRAAVNLPILRKDFIVDEFQVFEAAAAGADAILLIVAALEETPLSDLYKLATIDLGMDVIVEVHTLFELETAARIGAAIVGVNNRDLQTLVVSLDVSREMIPFRPSSALMISESGISTKAEIDELKSLGYDGFLIGETLMRTGEAQKTLEEWI